MEKSDLTEELGKALAAVRSQFAPTPLQHNLYLSELYGATIYVKREDLTPVRSYKIRGATNFFRAYASRGGDATHFVCASAGNHAQGFAYICRAEQKRGVIFMPVTTPQQKILKTKSFGGAFVEVRLIGDIFDECYAAAIAYAKDEGAILVPPFDHEDIVIGQASVGLEIMDALPDNVTPDMIISPVGGGGLSAGIILALQNRGMDVPLHLVEPKGAPSLHAALEAGHPVKLKKIDTFVDGAAVAQMGAVPFEIINAYSNKTTALIAEDRVCSTIIAFLNVEGIVLEPSGALAIDALKDFAPKDIKGKTIVVIVTGSNFDFERLPEVKERALRADGLKKYFVIRFPQRPGALKDFLNMLGPDDDITRFEYLKKSARNFGTVLIGLETTNKESFVALTARFDDSDVQYEDITGNEVLSNLVV